jgi:hypothetical protein
MEIPWPPGIKKPGAFSKAPGHMASESARTNAFPHSQAHGKPTERPATEHAREISIRQHHMHRLPSFFLNMSRTSFIMN